VINLPKTDRNSDPHVVVGSRHPHLLKRRPILCRNPLPVRSRIRSRMVRSNCCQCGIGTGAKSPPCLVTAASTLSVRNTQLDCPRTFRMRFRPVARESHDPTMAGLTPRPDLFLPGIRRCDPGAP
jgi:hypothetical protein